MFTIRRGEQRLSQESSVHIKVFHIDNEGFEKFITMSPLYKSLSSCKRKEDSIYGNREFIEEYSTAKANLRFVIVKRVGGRAIEMIKIRVVVDPEFPEKRLIYKDKVIFEGRAKFYTTRKHSDIKVENIAKQKRGLLI